MAPIISFRADRSLQPPESGWIIAAKHREAPMSQGNISDVRIRVEQPACPSCRSLEVSEEYIDTALATPWLPMLSVPLSLHGDTWKCHSCGCQWNADERP